MTTEHQNSQDKNLIKLHKKCPFLFSELCSGELNKEYLSSKSPLDFANKIIEIDMEQNPDLFESLTNFVSLRWLTEDSLKFHAKIFRRQRAYHCRQKEQFSKSNDLFASLLTNEKQKYSALMKDIRDNGPKRIILPHRIIRDLMNEKYSRTNDQKQTEAWLCFSYFSYNDKAPTCITDTMKPQIECNFESGSININVNDPLIKKEIHECLESRR